MSRPSRRPTVVLHIGAMKTGTTFLQHVMMANRERLAEAGFPFAGEHWVRQVRAAQELINLMQEDPWIRERSRGAWDEVTGEMLRSDGTSIMSMEFLSFARPNVIRRIRRTFADAEVHVILTVRDATATVPAMFQTSVTSRRVHTWEYFQRGVRRAIRPEWPAYVPIDSGVRDFRNTQDVPAMIQRWLKLVPPSHLHVVTVPVTKGDPMELWRRFCAPIGLDPEVAVNPPKQDNPSLGTASTELIRRLNIRLADLDASEYNQVVKDGLVAKMLSTRRDQEERITLTEATQRAALSWNARTARAIVNSGVDLVGSLDDLPTTPDAPGVKPALKHVPVPGDADVFAAAQDAARGLRRMSKRRINKIARKGGDQHPVPRLPRWVKNGHPTDLEHALDDLGDMTRRVVALRQEFRELTEAPGDN